MSEVLDCCIVMATAQDVKTFREKRALREQIKDADLSRYIAYAKMKNPGWTEERWAAAEARYREYLMSHRSGEMLNHPDADEIWHAHILHTEDYADFCERHFGRFVHHHIGCSGSGCCKDCHS